MHDLFSNIYFLSYVCSKSMKLIRKITPSVQTCRIISCSESFSIWVNMVVATVMNYFNDEIALLEKILVLVLILKFLS
jgi:hypothetical protein